MIEAHGLSRVVRSLVLACGTSALAAWALSEMPTPLVQRVVAQADPSAVTGLDDMLAEVLRTAGLTGNVEASLEARLGRPLDPMRVELGRLLFFDRVLGLHEDNSCAACHSPAFGFGDSQSMAIGIQNNGVVGPNRQGPRNQRRTPTAINTAFYPKLMWNGRFAAKSGDPFDNSLGFSFPLPEGDAVAFAPNDPLIPTLLTAQAHIPPTELVEMAGFRGVSRHPLFRDLAHLHQFDDDQGTRLPPDTNPQARSSDAGFLNDEIRALVLARLATTRNYLRRFSDVFEPGPGNGFRLTFPMIGQAIAEFEMSLTFADAPVDRFARGERSAMTMSQKRGALLFFGKARCSTCHVVGPSEMFSDFENHVLAVPQLAPAFGRGTGNVVFDGPNQDEDFGAEQVTGAADDRYAFRTSPLRNVAVQAAFFHNGAFTRLEDAIRHHLDVVRSVQDYDPVAAGVAADLAARRAGMAPVVDRMDSLVRAPIGLTTAEQQDLVAFVRDGLLDPRATRANACRLIPASVPSGLPMGTFQGCPSGMPGGMQGPARAMP